MLDDGLYSEYQLAHEIGGMTVEEMRRRMTHAEFLGWHSYFRRRNAEAEVRR